MLSDMRCRGDEKNISDCSYGVQHICSHHEHAGVICTNSSQQKPKLLRKLVRSSRVTTYPPL